MASGQMQPGCTLQKRCYTALMPIYEYRCRQCRHRFEYLVLSKSPAAQCPSCNGSDLEQLISLCSTSTEGTREANLSAAHRKAAGVRGEKERDEHRHLHEHFD
jgi:putative FmdB family regulatory protein